jgi:hypothetical protein
MRIPSSSRSPDHDPHRTIYYLGYPLGRFAGLKHRQSPDQWLAYRAEALLDLPPEQGAHAAGGASTVERVRTALVERDDALRRAREDLEGRTPSRRRGRPRSSPPAPSANGTTRPSRRLGG